MASKHVTSNQFKQSKCWKQTPSAGNANKPISTWKPKNTVIPFQGGSSSRLALDSRDTAKHLTIINHGGESIYPPFRHDYFRQCLGSGSALTRNILAPGAGTDKTVAQSQCFSFMIPDPQKPQYFGSWIRIQMLWILRTHVVFGSNIKQRQKAKSKSWISKNIKMLK